MFPETCFQWIHHFHYPYSTPIHWCTSCDVDYLTFGNGKETAKGNGSVNGNATGNGNENVDLRENVKVQVKEKRSGGDLLTCIQGAWYGYDW